MPAKPRRAAKPKPVSALDAMAERQDELIAERDAARARVASLEAERAALRDRLDASTYDRTMSRAADTAGQIALQQAARVSRFVICGGLSGPDAATEVIASVTLVLDPPAAREPTP